MVEKKAKFVKINEIEDLDSINAIKRKNSSNYLLPTTLSTLVHTNDLIFKIIEQMTSHELSNCNNKLKHNSIIFFGFFNVYNMSTTQYLG